MTDNNRVFKGKVLDFNTSAGEGESFMNVDVQLEDGRTVKAAFDFVSTKDYFQKGMDVEFELFDDPDSGRREHAALING